MVIQDAMRHHPSDELIVEYASGGLAEGWSIVVATHLALCPECRRRAGQAEQAAGMLISTLACDEVATDDGWARMRARILSEEKTVSTAQPDAPRNRDAKFDRRMTRQSPPVLPQPLRDYVGADLDRLAWRPLGRGAYHIPIAVSDRETRVRLLRIPAGKPVPEHSHGGRELTLVLAGSFHDATGRFGRGDLEEAYEDLEHQPIAGPEEDCICLVATDAPLRFSSWLVRLVQPVIGI